MENAFMTMAIDLAIRNVHAGRGGPFAAVVVKGGAVVAAGANQVTSTNDPTAHAEVVAIREACRLLGGFQLDGCDIYTTCEPCPMCLGAIYWARPARVFYACTQEDAAAFGFDDSFIYKQIQLPHEARSIPMIQTMREQARAPFIEWEKKSGKTEY